MIFRKVSKFLNILNRSYSQQTSKDLLILNYLKEEHVGIATLGLNRSERKNALSMNLLQELQKSMDQITYENKTRVLIIHSLVPDAFCAGADLKERAELDLHEFRNWGTTIRNFITKLYNLPVPVIAAIDGVALGGGLEIALACDIRVASSKAKMGLVETKWAIIPGAGGTQLLPRVINSALAKELIFCAETIDGKQAEKLGIINHVVEQNNQGNAAYLKSLTIAEKILPNGPLGVQMAKKAINKGTDLDFSTGLAMEEACYAQLTPTKDRAEGLQAFKEKRKPVYLGQ